MIPGTSPTRVRRVRLLLVALVMACASEQPAAPQDGEPPENALRVLFIGNSLTYENDLPAIVAALADSARVSRPFWYRVAAYPNYSLEDHWLDGRARTALGQRAWDVVILQQGPSSLPENQILLRDWSLQFAPLIRAAGARPALYMVWPEAARMSAFDAVAAAYTGAAVAVDGILFPVGRAWLEAWKRDGALPLHGADGFHPSVAGSWLAALVIVDRLYTVNLDSLPAHVRTRGGDVIGVSGSVRPHLVLAAKEANRSFGR